MGTFGEKMFSTGGNAPFRDQLEEIIIVDMEKKVDPDTFEEYWINEEEKKYYGIISLLSSNDNWDTNSSSLIEYFQIRIWKEINISPKAKIKINSKEYIIDGKPSTFKQPAQPRKRGTVIKCHKMGE